MNNLKISTFKVKDLSEETKASNKYYALKHYGYFLSESGEIVKILEIGTLQKDIVIVGKNFTVVEDLFTVPCPSSIVGVYKVKDLSRKSKLLSVNQIKKKFMVLPLSGQKDSYAVFSMH